MSKKINIAISGGPCTGKSTLASQLFSALKSKGFDYDLIAEEHRKLKKEFGDYRNPFERLYMWRQQEREEIRSTALEGFVTDTPLFHLYVSARMYAFEDRDDLAVRELFRMCLEIKDRYQLIVIPENPREFKYKADQVRHSGDEKSLFRHNLIKSFVEHHWPEKLHYVGGSSDGRVRQVMKKLTELRK